MTKVVYNKCYGGFGLSSIAVARYAELAGKVYPGDSKVDRTDPFLVQVVEELGDKAFTRFSKLKIVDLPAGTCYRIDEYDGNECIETESSIEWRTA